MEQSFLKNKIIDKEKYINFIYIDINIEFL